MIAYYITIDIFGTELLIDEILKKLGNKIKIEYIIHPNDKNPKTGEKYTNRSVLIDGKLYTFDKDGHVVS